MTFGFDDEPEKLTLPEPTMELRVELVPSTSWGANLRSELTKSQWDRLRKAQYVLAGHRCEICGGKGPRHPVECHEVWDYDDEVGAQTLVRLIALCPRCHEVKHYGLAESRGNGRRALKHLMLVNRWTEDEAVAHIKAAAVQWQERSEHQWILDLRWLENHGVPIPKTASW